jgi:dATP pyrophosphohydrolase
MARAPHNVLVLPFRRLANGAVEYAVFSRSDADQWQAVAGGVEDGETSEAAARREFQEETGLSVPEARWLALDCVASVPRDVFRGGVHWGPEVFVVQVRTFGVELTADDEIALSHEHLEHRWLPYAEAAALVRYDHDRTALWELAARVEPAALRADRRQGP